ncbi:bifunctional DNA primase/polymerase [Streptomyces sp. NBC_01384]|uniref:bifunctional DNA primase/polymerase n=1 Tax=Streptomyces sp. NBC_01384 TaxID=2903847 RepID=UPI0032526A01
MNHSTPWSSALAHALTAAGRGLAVFPLGPLKQPVIRNPHPDRDCRGGCGQFGHGVHDASTDSDTVRALFRAARRATGYGIACGRPPHHLIGLDLDRKNGLDGITTLTYLATQNGFHLPDTVTIATPSGGRHLWLAAPPDAAIPNSASRLGPGIDVRGSGGYLVGPGSASPKGAYQTLPGHPSDPAPAPLALLRLIQPSRPPVATPPARSIGPRSIEPLVRFVRDSPDGQLNNRLYWAACRAYEAANEPDAAADALLQAAIDAGHPERGAARTIASARNRAHPSPVTRPAAPRPSRPASRALHAPLQP